MKISAKGIDLIAGFEGCRLIPYQDSVGVWTIGFGHTHGVTRHTKPISLKRAKELLAKDLAWAEEAVNKLVKVKITQGQFDALVSFTFNLGAGALAQSTLLKLVNKRRWRLAALQFHFWVNAGGHKLLGLVRRRRAEARMFRRNSPKR